jgi:hypothetical protein
MPYQQIAYLSCVLISLSSCSDPGVASQHIDLAYGTPTKTRLGAAIVNYDGRDQIIVHYADRVLTLRALTPAQISISPNGAYLLHNFGNGSGQVYDIAVRNMRNGATLDISGFKRRVLEFARGKTTCTVRPDEISYLFERWQTARGLKIRTEDWTRRPGCEHLNRSWQLRLR